MKLAQRSSTQEMDVLCERQDDGASALTAHRRTGNGNLLSGGANSDMKWDAQNRMVGCTLAGNPNIVSTYTYGADGLRRSMTVGAVTTNYILDGQSVVRETTTDGKTRTYLNGPRGSEFCLETTSTGSKLRYYVYDGHGNVVGEADATGKIVDSTGTEKTFRNYDVWGAVRNSTEAGQSLSKNKYCGSLGHTSEPDTGLIYMRARYYDPALGRFISEDSAKDGGNWYAYAGNNPVGMVDPDGQVFQSDSFWQQLGLYMMAQSLVMSRQGWQTFAQGRASAEMGRELAFTSGMTPLAGAVQEAHGHLLEALGGIQQKRGLELVVYSALEAFVGRFMFYLGEGVEDFYGDLLQTLASR